MRAAVFFDVDGTLVPGTSSSQHVAGHLGHREELRRAEDAYAEGRMDNDQVSLLDAAGWRGSTQGRVRELLVDLPLVDGIPEVVAWCRDRDVAPYLATLAWEPVGRFLCERFGFDGACGPRLGRRGEEYTGAVAAHLDECGRLRRRPSRARTSAPSSVRWSGGSRRNTGPGSGRSPDVRDTKEAQA
jgi:phosphoserine phosphatase